MARTLLTACVAGIFLALLTAASLSAADKSYTLSAETAAKITAAAPAAPIAAPMRWTSAVVDASASGAVVKYGGTVVEYDIVPVYPPCPGGRASEESRAVRPGSPALANAS